MVQRSPGIDDIETAKPTKLPGVQRRRQVKFDGRAGRKKIAVGAGSLDAARVDVYPHNPSGAELVGGNGKKTAAATDIQKVFPREIVIPQQRAHGSARHFQAASVDALLRKAGP